MRGLLAPPGPRLILREALADLFVFDVTDPNDRGHVVSESAGEIEPGQFDPVAEDVIDPAEMTAVGADDFEVFLDQGEV